MLYDEYNGKSEKKGFLELMAKGPVMAPCVYDCVSAKLVEEAGYPAMCLSGGELAASLCGVPDIGLVTLDELAGVVERISSCTSIPMIVDIDTGFGNEINLIRTCKKIAAAGAKAVHLEDQTFPKRCGHLKGKEVISHEAFIAKIKAAAWALKGTGCALIARTDAYHVLGKDEAISRCNDAIDAGADITFIEGCGTVEDIKEAGARIKGPKMFAMLSSGASPKVYRDELYEWGYSLITLHYAMFASIPAMEKFGKLCLEAGSDSPITDDPEIDGRPIYLFEKFGIKNWFELGKTFNGKIAVAEEQSHEETR